MSRYKFVTGLVVAAMLLGVGAFPMERIQAQCGSADAYVRYIPNWQGAFVTHVWVLRIEMHPSWLPFIEQIVYRDSNVMGQINLENPLGTGDNYVDLWVDSSWAWENGMLRGSNRSRNHWEVYVSCVG